MLHLIAAVLTVLTTVTSLAEPPATTSGAGRWPLDPAHEVIHQFDPPDQTWGVGHRGVDLLGSPGQQVRAALAGTVSFAGRIAGRGVVVVDHGSTRTTYEPVEPAVHEGDKVSGGGPLGSLSWLGSHCLPRACLHWGLIADPQVYLDPLTLVACLPQPVRLLPLSEAPSAQALGCA